jgi:ADP-ribose pyrophosphatase YjhB (NUDIX family)
MKKLKVLSKKTAFVHPWEKIFIEKVKTEQGNTFDYLISVPNDFVIIIPFVDKENILMEKQYKHGAKKELLGFPAGFLKDKETPIEAAKRELLEETGYEFHDFKLVATLSENPTRCRNKYFIVVAKNVKNNATNIKNEDELEGDIEKIIVNKKDLTKKSVLKQIQAGPMLSAIPFLLEQ